MGARVLVVDDSPTIRKLVGSILARHDYTAILAGDGVAGLERLRQGDVDLILLDLVMPRMDGFAFCREIELDDKLRLIPVVLMSAKGDAIRAELAQQTTVVDAITKPFDARGLVAVIESALQKTNERRLHSPSEVVRDDDISIDEEEMGDSATMPGAEDERGKVETAIANKLAAVLGPALWVMPEARRKDTAEIASTIRRALGPTTLEELRPLWARFVEQSDVHLGFAGNLHVIPLAEVLQVLQLQRQTGTCLITNGQVEMTVSVRDGLIDLARSKGAADEFRLGRYLVEEGSISKTQLSELLKSRPAANGLLGEALIGLGLISEADLQRALARQTSELIYEVLRWPNGRFRFTRHASDEQGVLRLGLAVASIVMEGYRRVDEWSLIEGSIHFDEVLLRDQVALDGLGAQQLTRQEQLVLESIDGQRSVREIIGNAHVGSFDACKILYQFLQSRLVRRRAA
jgi:CheY-like chemotaxis protein